MKGTNKSIGVFITILVCAAIGIGLAQPALLASGATLPRSSSQSVYLPLVIRSYSQFLNTVILALGQEPDTLHPGIGSMMAKTIVLSPVFLGCMGQDETATWIPLGCETIPTLENGGAVFVGTGADKHLEVTYQIKAGWRWTDDTPVTTKDAIYWWWLLMQPNFEVADRTGTEKIYTVSALNDSTILLKFLSENQVIAAAQGTLPAVTTEFGLVNHSAFHEDYAASYPDPAGKGPVVDPAYWTFIGWWPSHILKNIAPQDQGSSDFARKPVGDGAYTVKEWNIGQEIILEKSNLPFALGNAKTETIVFRFFSSAQNTLTALQTGQIDATTSVGNLSVNDAVALDTLEAGGAYKVLYQAGYQWEHIDLNTAKFPLNDMKVRQALFYGLNRQALVDTLYHGKQQTTDLPVPKGLSWAYTENYTKHPYNLEQAKTLLAEAGWNCTAMPCTKLVGGELKNLEITISTTNRADRQLLANAIHDQWEQLNVKVETVFYPGRGLFAPCSEGGPLNCRTFDAAIYTWITGDDPQLIGLYGSSGGQNYPGWVNAVADAALACNELNMDTCLSREKRKPCLETFFQEWTREVPVIPLFSNTSVYVIRSGFANWKAGPTAASADAWNAWEWEVWK